MAKSTTSIELVDFRGRKVRVTVTGHWDDLVGYVSEHLLNDKLLGLSLSDLEQDRSYEDGEVVYASPTSEFFEASKGLDSEPPFEVGFNEYLEAVIDMQYDAWDEPRDVREGWDA